MKRVVISLLLIILVNLSFSQINADSLFQVARKTAFAKDYPAAREICNKILSEKPHYNDVRILLGRTYAWDKQYSVALDNFNKVLEQKPQHKDATSAKANVLLWSKDYEQLLSFTNTALGFNRNNEEVLYLNAVAYEKLERFREAANSYKELLEINPSHHKSEKALERLKLENMTNKISVRSNYDYFFKEIDPWIMNTVEFSRK